MEQMRGEAERREKLLTSFDINVGAVGETLTDGGITIAIGGGEIALCREMQLDEIEALDAIYTGSDEYRIREDANVELLRSKIGEWQESSDEAILNDIMQHPPLSFTLELNIQDENDVLAASSAGIGDPVATILLQVVLPLAYPESALPHIEVAYFAVTDRSAQINADKALESLVHLEEERLLQELREQARQIVPMPCIYELAATWLTDHLFEFCKLRTHAHIL